MKDMVETVWEDALSSKRDNIMITVKALLFDTFGHTADDDDLKPILRILKAEDTTMKKKCN